MTLMPVDIALNIDTTQLQAMLHTAADAHFAAGTELRKAGDDLYRKAHPGTPDCEDCGRPAQAYAIDGFPRWRCGGCMSYQDVKDLGAWRAAASPEVFGMADEEFLPPATEATA